MYIFRGNQSINQIFQQNVGLQLNPIDPNLAASTQKNSHFKNKVPYFSKLEANRKYESLIGVQCIKIKHIKKTIKSKSLFLFFYIYKEVCLRTFLTLGRLCSQFWGHFWEIVGNQGEITHIWWTNVGSKGWRNIIKISIIYICIIRNYTEILL